MLHKLSHSSSHFSKCFMDGIFQVILNKRLDFILCRKNQYYNNLLTRIHLPYAFKGSLKFVAFSHDHDRDTYQLCKLRHIIFEFFKFLFEFLPTI